MNQAALNELIQCILAQQDRVVELQKLLTAIPALGPENGGQGELKKAELIEKLISNKADIIHVNSPDSRVESGLRPNIIAVIPGQTQEKLWLFGHMDVVPAGKLSLWTSNPWKVRQENDLIYGRGVEDNQQAIASMLILLECLHKLNIKPLRTLVLVFMSDEENGSKHGLKYILEQKPQLFSEGDLYIVPDGGSPNGTFIEIAEKGQLWLKFVVKGKQCHASVPDIGINSLIISSELVLKLNELNNIFNERDSRFSPDRSTFTPTKHEENIEAVNIVPGEDIFYMDCRLLPNLSSKTVLSCVKEICDKFAAKYNINIIFSVIHEQTATQITSNSPIVNKLKNAISQIFDIEAHTGGIGGATVAALLREKNLAAIVWASLLNTCHQPDECSSITSTLKDSAVFANILMTR